MSRPSVPRPSCRGPVLVPASLRGRATCGRRMGRRGAGAVDGAACPSPARSWRRRGWSRTPSGLGAQGRLIPPRTSYPPSQPPARSADRKSSPSSPTRPGRLRRVCDWYQLLGRLSYEVCPNCGFEFGNDRCDHRRQLGRLRARQPRGVGGGRRLWSHGHAARHGLDRTLGAGDRRAKRRAPCH